MRVDVICVFVLEAPDCFREPLRLCFLVECSYKSVPFAFPVCIMFMSGKCLHLPDGLCVAGRVVGS